MTDGKLQVCEIFTSIQGESSHAGKPCCFIRLSGCNLECRDCDTEYSRQTDVGEKITIAEIVSRVRQEQVEFVEITGGEPLLQDGVPQLCRELLDEGFSVLVETNGSLPIGNLPEGTIRILDCKCPSSGMMDRMDLENYQHLNYKDEVKFVIADREDFDYAVKIISEYDLTGKVKDLLLSPSWGKLAPATLAEWIIEKHLSARLQLQQHKLIWEPDKRGV